MVMVVGIVNEGMRFTPSSPHALEFVRCVVLVRYHFAALPPPSLQLIYSALQISATRTAG
jgi:hypothetical protein